MLTYLTSKCKKFSRRKAVKVSLKTVKAKVTSQPKWWTRMVKRPARFRHQTLFRLSWFKGSSTYRSKTCWFLRMAVRRTSFFYLIVEETNRYARQKLVRSAARFDKWTDVKKRKLKAYIGLCIIMGNQYLATNRHELVLQLLYWQYRSSGDYDKESVWGNQPTYAF